jgi:hypothetical protein
MLEHDRQPEINVRERGRRSPEWIIQRPWQNWARNAQEVDTINKKHNAENWKDEIHGPHQATGVNPGGREWWAISVSYKTHPLCYSHGQHVGHHFIDKTWAPPKVETRTEYPFHAESVTDIPTCDDRQWQNKQLDKILTRIRLITKLPNFEQSSKGKIKTHKYINRQNQSTTGKLWKP